MSYTLECFGVVARGESCVPGTNHGIVRIDFSEKNWLTTASVLCSKSSGDELLTCQKNEKNGDNPCMVQQIGNIKKLRTLGYIK